jgi:hypothetical protein
LIDAYGGSLRLDQPDIRMAFGPYLTVRTATAETFTLQSLALQMPAFDHSHDSVAGRAIAAWTIGPGRKTIQMLGNKQGKSTFADTGGSRKNHCMGKTILFYRAPQYFYRLRIAEKGIQTDRVFHGIHCPVAEIQVLIRHAILKNTWSGVPRAGTTWIL